MVVREVVLSAVSVAFLRRHGRDPTEGRVVVQCDARVRCMARCLVVYTVNHVEVIWAATWEGGGNRVSLQFDTCSTKDEGYVSDVALRV